MFIMFPFIIKLALIVFGVRLFFRWARKIQESLNRRD